MLAWRDIAVRYRQSVMGFLWAILMPSLIVLAGIVVRLGVSRVAGTPTTSAAVVAILAKSLPWALFVSSIRLATTSLTSNSSLVTRANCPRIAFPLAAVLSCLFDFVVALPVLITAIAVIGAPISVQLIWVLPLLAILIALILGLSIALSAANLFYRDIKYLVEIGLMFAIFFTPVLYEVEMAGSMSRWLLMNPVAPLLEGLYSAIVLARQPDLGWVLYSALVSTALASAAIAWFRRVEPTFADHI
jgi:lipopolysaccharide transport system permease protein